MQKLQEGNDSSVNNVFQEISNANIRDKWLLPFLRLSISKSITIVYY